MVVEEVWLVKWMWIARAVSPQGRQRLCTPTSSTHATQELNARCTVTSRILPSKEFTTTGNLTSILTSYQLRIIARDLSAHRDQLLLDCPSTIYRINMPRCKNNRIHVHARGNCKARVLASISDPSFCQSSSHFGFDYSFSPYTKFADGS